MRDVKSGAPKLNSVGGRICQALVDGEEGDEARVGGAEIMACCVALYCIAEIPGLNLNWVGRELVIDLTSSRLPCRG